MSSIWIFPLAIAYVFTAAVLSSSFRPWVSDDAGLRSSSLLWPVALTGAVAAVVAVAARRAGSGLVNRGRGRRAVKRG